MDAPATPRTFLPLGIALADRRCLVVGGGAVGTRKALTLTAAGAAVTVVAPALTPDLARAVAAGRVRYLEGPYDETQLDGMFLVVAATGDKALNAAVAAAAERRGALACDASSGQGSGVIFGALLDLGGAKVAVFTDGRDPALARATRDRIAAHLAPGPRG